MNRTQSKSPGPIEPLCIARSDSANTGTDLSSCATGTTEAHAEMRIAATLWSFVAPGKLRATFGADEERFNEFEQKNRNDRNRFERRDDAARRDVTGTFTWPLCHRA